MANRHFELPTKDEQLQLRETRNLMSHGVLQLQMEEMLLETRIPEKPSSTLRNWVDKLTQTIKGIRPAQHPITPLWMKEQGINEIPFLDTNTSINFRKPDNIQTIGSFRLQVATNPFVNIDLAIELPSEILDDRDILNHSYFDKRNLYLGYLYQFLSKQSDIVREISLGFLKSDSRKPLVVIQPNLRTEYSVRIFITAPEESFKLTQLRPSKNNVRPLWWIDSLMQIRNDPSRSTTELDPKSLSPTPNYNMTILEDVVAIKAHEYLLICFEKHPSLRDIVLAIKIWLTQREFRWGIDSLDGHLVLFLVAYLSVSGIILPHMTALTGFMAFLKYLSELARGSQHCLSLDKHRHPCGSFPIELYLPTASDDNSGIDAYNFLWRVSATSLDQLIEQAQLSLCTLQAPPTLETTIATASFRSVFLQKSNFFQNYDLIFHLPSSLNLDTENMTPAVAEILKTTKTALDDLTPWQYTSRKVRTLLEESLGNRVTKVHTFSQPQSSNSRLMSSIFSTPNPGVIVGILLNSTHMNRRVDRGPPATDEAACVSFKQFWGQKSEMRRFKDGSIIEAVVWSENDFPAESKTIRPSRLVTTIIQYILRRHLPFSAEIQMASDQIADLLPEVSQNLPVVNLPTANLQSYSTQGLYRRAIETVDVLRRLMSNLKGFPLAIESLRATSPALRYTSFFPPLFNPLISSAKYAMTWFSGERANPIAQVISLVADLEKSSRWPDELLALRSLKSALIVKLSACLEQQFAIRSIIHSSTLDIFFEGYIFRLSFYTDQELPLLAPEIQAIDNLRLASIREKCPREFSNLYRKLIIDPQHHLAVHTLCSKYESFSDTVRLLSLWLDAQFLSGYLDYEILELVVASVYLPSQISNGNEPHCAPFGLMKALARISEFEWENHPLLVDLSFGEEERASSADLDLVYSEFTTLKRRPTGGPCFSIAAKYEHNEPFTFDYGLPLCDRSILNMVTTAAKMSLQNLVSVLDQTSVIPPGMSILRNRVPVFDVTIKFVRSAFSSTKGDDQYCYNSLLEGPRHSQVEILQNIPVNELPDFLVAREENLPHPFQSEYVAKLRNQFDHLALFFFNQLEGAEVGIVWKPNAFFPRNFSALHSLHRTFVHEKSMATINVPNLVSEMVSMGNGLVERVIVR